MRNAIQREANSKRVDQDQIDQEMIWPREMEVVHKTLFKI